METRSQRSRREILDQHNFRRRLAFNEKAKQQEAASAQQPQQVGVKRPRGRPRGKITENKGTSSETSHPPNTREMDDPYININFIPPYKLQFKDDCTYYGARRYCYEPPTFCCAKGQIVLANQETPVPLRNLFCAADDLSKHFQVCVRTYNNTFAFTSMGIHNYATDLCRRNKGIYTFKVQGQIYHFINDMLPDGCPLRNLQLYFYDTETISQETMAYHGTRLDKEVIDVILSTLAENPYAKFFHNLRYMNTAEEFSVILKKNPTLDQRVYNMPTASQVAAIWVEDDGNGQDKFTSTTDNIVYNEILQHIDINGTPAPQDH
ncbi:unnamed protein product [Cuscuta campestris]|uniref:Uncharacterized protein n=1 Tax=Cuscuta campestris TaxID=132261 RepID=A0A484MSJ2_9ASTE|nr:unnamed protein product [Cuscuta campestris]